MFLSEGILLFTFIAKCNIMLQILMKIMQNSNQKTATVQIRVQPEYKEKLSIFASQENRSLPNFLKNAVDFYLDKHYSGVDEVPFVQVGDELKGEIRDKYDSSSSSDKVTISSKEELFRYLSD